MRRHIAVILVILALSVWFQAWFLGLTPGGLKLGDPKLSTAYTEALAHGQSYLLANPDPRLLAAKDPFGPATAGLMIWDTSFYHGHFYMYFGIVPFVVFMVPWLKITGSAPSPELAILVFSVLGYLAYGGILVIAVRRFFSKASAFWEGAAFLTVIVASGTWPLMGRPAIFEIENAAAYAFMGLSLCCLAQFELDDSKTIRSLALATGFAALTMGCRPNYFPAVTIITLWALMRSWSKAKSESVGVICAAAPLFTVIGVGLSLAYWNYHRFGSPIDFGLKHTVSDDPAQVRPLSALANLPYHLHRYLVGMPRLDRYFPFIQGQREGPFQLRPWQEVSNQVYGFMIVTPILTAVLLIFRYSRADSALRYFCFVCLTASFGNMLFLSSVTMSCYRYPADFLGPFAVTAALGITRLSYFGRLFRTAAYCLISLALFWSTDSVALESFSIAQTAELFEQKRPHDFFIASLVFNHAVFAYDSIAHRGFRVFKLRVSLPRQQFGKSDPLLVTGENGAEDFIYLYYAGPGLMEVGFESSGLGGVVSKPIRIDYDSTHRVELCLGSFLPPDDCPLYRNIPAVKISEARQTLIVSVDGIEVIKKRVHFHSPRGQIFLGNSPFDAAFGTKFHGSLQYLPSEMNPDLFIEEVAKGDGLMLDK